MTELFIILLIIICTLCFAFRKPSAPVIELPKVSPQVFEDPTLLKQQYATLEQKYHSSLQKLGQLQYSEQQLHDKALQLALQVDSLTEQVQKVQHQSKSSQVKTGTFVEILAPLAEQFCVNPKTMRFLGSPIDYISFDYETDMITIVEVKSGDAVLNDNQRKVKSMVERGRVQFKVVRLNEKGIKVK